MKLFSIAGAFGMVCVCAVVYAHTARDITIKCNFEENSVTVTIGHITRARSKDYVRKIEVIADTRAPVVKNYPYQKHNERVILQVPIPDLGSVGKLTVKSYPTVGRGIVLTREFDVQAMKPPPEPEKAPQPEAESLPSASLENL